MISLSSAFRRELYYNRRNYLAYADITLEDGTVLNLTNTEIWAGGFTKEDAVSNDNSFSALGSAIIGSATLIINNMAEAYSGYDFTNADVVTYIGMQLNDNGVSRLEKLKMGTYTVDEAKYNGATITLELLDYMAQFDRPYTSSVLIYPATLSEIVREACLRCDVTLSTSDFPHSDYTVRTKPESDSITFREVIGWAAAIAGCFARCNRDGQLELKWFDQETLESRRDGYDGGSFDSGSPYYTSGDDLNGGTFDPWSDGSEADAGEFSEETTLHYISGLYSQNIGVDDVVITGVRITVKTGSQESGNFTRDYTSGNTGYMIGIENNDFITTDTAQTVADWLGSQLIGLTFRRASVSHASNPAIEAGDVGALFDRKSREYPVLITRTVFSIGKPQTTVCGAETPARNSATRYGWQTKSYVESRKMLKSEQTTREQALQNLTDRLAEHSGLYSTTDEQESGNIYYLHDMPDLEDSEIVWKMTRDAWGVSTDGGQTWNGGMTVDGAAIVRILSAIGVDADWLNTGCISSQDGSVSIDLDTGAISIKGVTSFDGFVTDTELSTAGQTTINGANITTGSIKDANNNTVFDLSTGSLTIKSGSINLGNGAFRVDNSGNVVATNATLTGYITAANLSTAGQSAINAANLTSGTISDANGNTTINLASGKIKNASGSEELEIDGALLKGYYQGVNYGTLDLCASYAGSYGQQVSLNSAQALYLTASGRAELTGSNVYIQASGSYVHMGISSTFLDIEPYEVNLRVDGCDKMIHATSSAVSFYSGTITKVGYIDADGWNGDVKGGSISGSSLSITGGVTLSGNVSNGTYGGKAVVGSDPIYLYTDGVSVWALVRGENTASDYILLGSK